MPSSRISGLVLWGLMSLAVNVAADSQSEKTSDRPNILYIMSDAVPKPTEPHWELYDLVKDPYEMNNVFHNAAYAKVVDELKAELLQLKQQLGDKDEPYPELVRRFQGRS